MKYFPIIFFLLLVTCSDPKPEMSVREDRIIELPQLAVGDEIISKDNPSISVKNGVTYFLDEKYTGWVYRYEKNSILISKTGYYQGLQQDTLYKYHPTGEIAEKRPYHQGKKHGIHEGWYPDGSISFRYEFVLGSTEGVQKKWRPSGMLAFVRNYQDGRMLGLQQGWLPNGKIRCNYHIKENGKKYGLLGVNDCVSVEEDFKRSEDK